MRTGILHTAFIGDMAFVGLLVEALFDAGHDIFLIGKPSSLQIFEGDARISKLLPIQKKNGFKKISSIRENANRIAELALDVLLVPHKSFHSAILAKMSGVKTRVGFAKMTTRFAFTSVVNWRADVHESQRYLMLGREFLDRNRYDNFFVFARPVLRGRSDLKILRERLPEFFESQTPYFVISPGSVWHTKKYPIPQLFEVVVGLLKKAPNLNCAINGGPMDRADIDEILELAGQLSPDLKARIFDLSSLLSLPQSVTLIAHAGFNLANDSGPLHIGSGTNTPTVAIYGPSPFDTGLSPSSARSRIVAYKTDVAPLACQPCSPHGGNRCPLGHHRCMKELPSNLVIDAVTKLLPEIFRG